MRVIQIWHLKDPSCFLTGFLRQEAIPSTQRLMIHLQVGQAGHSQVVLVDQVTLGQVTLGLMVPMVDSTTLDLMVPMVGSTTLDLMGSGGR